MGLENPHLSVAEFERALLCGDAATLADNNYHDAACVAAGDYNIFAHDHQPLHNPSQPTNWRSVPIARQCVQICSTELTHHSTQLASALADAGAGSTDALYASYVAGVALLQAFIRENWAGPIAHPQTPDEGEAAGFFLSVDGEDVARPSRYLHWLRAARLILVDSISEFVRNGATLAPWWASRVILAHQNILSNPTPTLQYELFSMYGRFLGAEYAETRFLFGGRPKRETPVPDSDSDNDLLPAPVQEGDEDIHDEEADFGNRFVEDDERDRELMTLALLELTLSQKLFYDGDGALRSLRKACEMAGVAFRVSGEMGVRTKHQQKPTAQLIGRVYRVDSPSNGKHPCDCGTSLAMAFPREESAEIESTAPFGDTASFRVDGSLPLPKNVPLDDTDALGYVKLTDDMKSVGKSSISSQNDDNSEEETDVELGSERKELRPLEQAIAIGQAGVVRARNASHGLTNEEMAPYVALVLRNSKSSYGTSSVAQIRALQMRVSFEGNRGRYLERCMTQMEEIGNFIDEPMQSFDSKQRAAAAAERNLFVFTTSLPPRWELKKEVAITFGRVGLVKSAMEIFEQLEYWDELVDCHRLIGNLGAAEALVRDQLEKLDAAVLEDGNLETEEQLGIPFQSGPSGAVQARAARRPRLLCVLGDVTRNREHFVTAWEESGRRYARAKRALGRLCVEAEEWEEAVVHFREALEINALFPETWFTYGCSAMHINDMHTAANAFTRVVQQTPENGEAWNNLGRVLHDLGKKKESLRAFMEAARVKRDSWRIWNNALIIAVELRSGRDMVLAMERLLDLRGKDGVVSEAVEAAVTEVIRMSGSADIEDKAFASSVTRRLIKILGRCSSLVSTNASIWTAYAELYEAVPSAGGKQKAFDCRLKQVRALIAKGDWRREIREFRHMVIATDALVTNAKLSENNLSVRAASLHVSSVIEQTKEDFKKDDGFTRLVELDRSIKEE